MRSHPTALGTALCVATFALSGRALAQNEWVEPPKPAPVLDERPNLPAGHPTLCSDRLPLCLHASTPTAAHKLVPALAILEQAYRRVVFVLGWRPPAPDLSGPSSGFDVYLGNLASPWTVHPDPMTDVSYLARASAFARVREDLFDSCHLSFAFSAAIARAGIYAIDAAANDELANASATYLGMLAEPCPNAFVAGIDDFQASPHLAVSNPAHDEGRGAVLFPWFLQDSRGRGGPADLLHALWALSPQPPPKDSATLLNEPDFLDAVATLATDTRRSLPDLWLDFAVARAFTGNRDDGVHLPDTRFLGSAGAVRFEWSVPYATLPRRLAPRFPVEPSGASYVWLSLDDAPKNAGLGFRAEWEPPDVFRFALVLVDAQGQTLTRHNPVSQERGTSAEANLETLEGAAGLIVVATNTGSVLRDIAFDPDNHPYTARSYAVSLFAQQ